MKIFQSVLFLMFSLMTTSAFTAEYTVQLLTSGENGAMMIMNPGYIKINKGDVIKFVPSDSSHNAQSFSIPNGAKAFVTPMGKETQVRFEQDGVYLYKCLPHTVMGMLGVVQVGEAINIEQSRSDWLAVKPTIAMNKERMDQYLSEVK
ncbi:MAG: pseudoazurin [Aliivibrio sp.]|uniref:pseudoazurin n=1 Tax=Aliivibrio sp. TaxID=1872443 RepID=UPI001A61D2DA|nr:pseudoazurin [Aliivibrio sp.]